MFTTERYFANQQNAQHSTGPRTVEGKQRSSQNAQTHGLSVSDQTLQRESPEELNRLIASHAQTYQPQNEAEVELVRQLALATIRLRRVERAEEQIWDQEGIVLDVLVKFERYRSSAERSFHKHFRALETLRKERSKSQQNKPMPQVQTQPEPETEQTQAQPGPIPIRITREMLIQFVPIKLEDLGM